MTLLNKLKAFLAHKSVPFPQSKHIIKHAFTAGGIDYYEFDTTANLPWKRGLKFLAIYNELDMRCDRFFLTKHTEAVENILTNSKKIGLDEIVKIRQLNAQLKERLNWIYHEDLIYKVASVVFFDATENPDDWEWKYASQKIERWKKQGDAASFFLHEPIQRLIPFLKDANLNIPNYSQVQKEIDHQMLENIFTSLPQNQKKDSVSYTQRYFFQEMKQG